MGSTGSAHSSGSCGYHTPGWGCFGQNTALALFVHSAYTVQHIFTALIDCYVHAHFARRGASSHCAFYNITHINWHRNTSFLIFASFVVIVIDIPGIVLVLVSSCIWSPSHAAARRRGLADVVGVNGRRLF